MRAAGRAGTAAPRSLARADRRSGERGQGTLELVALIPVLLLTLVALLQVMSLAYTSFAASQAARDAARAHSLDQSPVEAAQASLPGAVRLVNLTTFGPGHGVTVTVVAPPVLLAGQTVTRSVVMP
jgi:hypothetical protein